MDRLITRLFAFSLPLFILATCAPLADGSGPSGGAGADPADAYGAMPVGAVLPFAGPAAAVPAGWLLCDGQAYGRADSRYSRLFAVIGTAWGSPDAGRFNVPDLRGMFLRGTANGSANDPDRDARIPSQPGGNEGDMVGSAQPDAFQSHWHQFSGYNDDYHNAYQGQHSLVSNSHILSGHIGNPVTDTVNGTPRTAGETRPINASVNYIIKY